VLESQHKGSNASSIRSPVVDEERIRLGVTALFPSVLLHCWLANRKDIKPIKTHVTYPQRFFSETSEERKLRLNQLILIHLKKCC